MTTAVRPLPGMAREYRFPQFERHILDNGMQVIVAAVRKLPVVSVLAVIDAGAASEAPGKEGIAELTAQSLREGTTERDGLQLTVDFEQLGTSLEAGADWDTSVVSMTLLRDSLTAAFDLFSDVLRSPALPESGFERLRAERLAERMQILSEPRGLADESFSRFVYGPSARYQEPMSGSTESISRISHADIQGFHSRNYTPDAVTMIIAGDLDVDEGIELVNKSFSSWKGERKRIVQEADMRARSSRATELVGKTGAAQSELRIGHVGVPRLHPDYFNIVVMNAVLGGLFSSRINLNLREAHGYTYGASSHFDWRRGCGPFVISTAVESEVTGAAISEILGEIDKMQREEISDEELTLATSYLGGVFPIRYESTAAIASALATMVAFGLPGDYYDTYRERVRRVTTRDVLSAARKYVNADELQLVVVGDPSKVRAPLEGLGIGPLSVRDATES